MKILLAGGGSGGHVTPLKAIIAALKDGAEARLEFTVVTDRGFFSETKSIFTNEEVKLKKIFSGKYRRYKNKSFMWHILHLPTLLKNLRDVFSLGLGTVQSIWYFLLHKPDVVFCKGGFVCVPIGIAAHLFRVPLIIHDSDTRPGLTNRILSRWAVKIGTGMPTAFYPYENAKMLYTGIPVDTVYAPVAASRQADYKQSLELSTDRPLLLVTGGGKGATPLNEQITAIAEQLITDGWTIAHITGRGKATAVVAKRGTLPAELRKHWVVEEFVPMAPRLLAADLVVCRTSASTIQECANAEKLVIGVPSQNLDDQKKNAQFFASKDAIIALDEGTFSPDGSELLRAITELTSNKKQSEQLAKNLHANFAKPHAAKQLAELIIDAASS